MLADLIEEEEMASSLPEAAHAMFRLMLDLLADLNSKIADLDKAIARRAREDEVSRRLMTVPGIGPISATAIAALAPPAETFATGRGLCRLAGSHASSKVDRRQAEAWRDVQNGRTHAPTATHHWQ
jgi:transposase